MKLEVSTLLHVCVCAVVCCVDDGSAVRTLIGRPCSTEFNLVHTLAQLQLEHQKLSNRHFLLMMSNRHFLLSALIERMLLSSFLLKINA
jgi:hypothetical protein